MYYPTLSKARIGLFITTVLVVAAALLSVKPAHASCSSPGNQIEAENCLPGNPETDWLFAGSGDPTIQGFATDISFNVGQRVNFKVNTDATSYILEIFRMGYYGGMGARKLTVISPSVSLPQAQPACLFDNATALIDCGNWSPSASWQIPANATPGVYFAHLIRQDTGGDSHIFFIVRNDTSHSDIVYQTSDLTWQAYNNYGGHSLYGSTEFDIYNRAFKVSYNRPFNTRAAASNSFIFNAEYPMIRWLEANGYDVTYISGIDTSRYGNLLLNHKVFMSSGHDEYWDTIQRTNVQAARDAGVNLAFSSGNVMFWKTRWESSVDGTNTPYRTLVCYKETYATATDPLDPPMWTGTWQDPSKSPPADGGRPQNALTGTFFKVNGPGVDNTDLSMQVPAADGKLRFWRNTAIANLAPNQTATLPPGTLGYEWDIDPDNLVRPPGLFHLSTATYNLTTDYLLDYGVTYGNGAATHHVTTYRAPSGALVFGAGSVQWSWGLDSDHDGDVNPDPDPNMQQATVNLFADMGVQPVSLQAGLQAATQSTDSAAPVSTITSPVPSATVNAGSIVSVSGTAIDSGGGVVAGVEISLDGGQTWHAAAGRENWTYTWIPSVVGTPSLQSRAVDDSGNLENPQTSNGNPPGGVQVTVNPQVCPCSIWNPSSAPYLADSGDSSSVEVGVKFQTDNDGAITGIRFYKASNNTGTHVGHLWTSTGTLLATATFTTESGSGWQQVQFANPVSVTAETTYVASYFTSSGHYSADVGYFLGSGVDDPPVHALADGVSGHNGIFIYTPTPGVFPTNNYAASNYWVDVVFVNGTTFNIGGQITGIGGSGATVALTGGTNAATTTDSAGNYSFAGLVAGTYTITPSNPGVVFTPASQTVTLNGLSLNNVDFSAAAINPLSISGTVSGGGGLGTIVILSGAASLATVTDSSGNYSFNGLIQGSYVITPTQPGYIFAPDSQAVTLSNTNVSGMNFSAQPCPCTTIWQPTAAPVLIDGGDGKSVEVGVRFQSDVPGHIQALRFYKANANVGTHTGHVWSNTGALLGSATFINESASGWQEVVFVDPVPVAANTTYVASYFAPSGHYSFDVNYFLSTGVDNPPLHALADGTSGPDGTYAYGSSPTYPSSGFASSNYWVDVVFMPSPPHDLSGTIGGPGGPGATVTLSGGVTITTTADAFGNWSFTNLPDGTYLVTPSQAGFAFTAASRTITLSGADLTGVMFATLSNCAPCDSIWQPTSTPVSSDAGDPQSVNVGVKFRADSDGYILGLRFYKSTLNTGTHTGTLWSDSGVALGSVTFSDESQFGWQQALFSNPIAVIPNTTYVVSYFAPAGHYAGTNSFFASNGVDSSPLHALADGVDGPNGVFAYGSTSVFPTQTYLASNYWVDVLFTPSAATYTISGTISGASGPNATVSLTGTANATTTADSAGNYSFSGLSNGNYWVTPSQPGYAFVPGIQAVAVLGTDMPGVNFGTVQNCPCNTIWQASTQPMVVDGGDGQSVNVGVKFRADADGYIVGLKFYKAALNTGIHVGNLWSDTGTPLANATFTTEAPTGWQQVLFNSAVPVSANTTYVASYLAPVGHYSADTNFFATVGVDSPPLHALANGVDGPNGLFTYSVTSAFPTQSYQAANYWVDVIYAGTQTYSIAGTISGPGGPGATVNLSGTSAATTTADGSGNYSFSGLANGSYMVTPSNGRYVFTPASQAVTINGAHVMNVNFSSAPQAYSASGTISGPGGAGATVNLTGASTATTTADGSGNYSFTGLQNGSYTVTPSQTGFVYTPASQAITVNGANLSAVNFTSAQLFTISGTISGSGGSGATVNLTGASTATTTADGSGNYSFTGLLNGSYTVTPTGAGFLYTPASQAVTVNGANLSVNFASAQLFTISGTISGPGGAGATVNLTGASTATTTADGSGNYSFTGLLNGSYLVTPANSGYVFTPVSQIVVVSGSNFTGLNFSTVSGCPTCNTIWPATAAPTAADSGDTAATELGVKFLADSDGYITGLRFYKASTNTGTHVGHLWTSTGTLLGSATFTSEGVSGWQQVLFATPLPVVANTTYVASYFAPAGHYAGDSNFFATAGVDNPPLHALANGADGPNGIYLYSPNGGFPTSTLQSTNYWVDVVYATGQGYSIVGTISGPGAAGATVSLTGASTATTTADASGNYSFSGLANGSYTVTPSNGGHVFTPASQTVTINSAHAMNVNFTAVLQTYSISGTISGTGGKGATVNLSGTSTATTTADGSGNYSFTGLANGSYTVTPTQVGFVYTPSSQAVTISGSNATVNFTSAQLFSLSGTVAGPGGPGATVNLTGAATAATTADASGNYSFTGLLSGTYTVTPNKSGYVFSPTSLSVTISGANASAVNFGSSVFVTSVVLNPTSVIGGSNSTGTVTLSGPAPSGGAVVTLSSSNIAAAQVPATVTVAANATTATFPVTSTPVATTTSLTISGTYGSTQSASFTVTRPTLASLSLNPSSVPAGISSVGTVTLSGPAPAGGAIVTLSSSNTSAAQVPASVTVAANATTATFTVTTSSVASNTTLTISGTYGSTQTASFTVTSAVLSTITLSPASVIGGTSSTGTVTLTKAAPTGGAVVALSSSNTSAAQVPASVTVAAGATTATFTATTTPVASNTSLTITGTYGATKTATLTVTAPTLSSIGVNPTSVIGGASSTGTVRISGPAPAGGAVVTLSSSNTAAAQVPASVTIAANATTATFTATTSPVAANASVVISATYNGTKTATLTVTAPAPSSVTLNPASVVGGNSSTGTVTLTGPAPAGGAVVTLSSNNTAAANVPASVTVAANATAATFTVTTSPVAANASVTISATYNGTKTATLTVTAPAPSSVTLNPQSVIGGTSSTGTVTLTGPAPAGGAVVTLSSNNTAAANVPASVTVAANTTAATFTVTTSPVAANASVTISATYNATKTATLTVTPPSLTSFRLNPISVIGGTPSTGTVILTGPAPGGGAVVSLSSANTAAATVPSSVTVPANSTTATFTVTSIPVGANTSATISATYNGNRTANLTVTAPSPSSFTLNPTTVIGGTSSTGTVILTGPAPASGAVVNLSSNNPGAAKVPTNVTVAANATTATFTVTTSPVATNASATISATYNGTKTAILTVAAPTISTLTLNPTTVKGPAPSTGTVTLTGPAPSGGAVVTLSSNLTSAATVPASVTVAVGNASATFTVTTKKVTTTSSVTISATKGVTATAGLTVTP